jgi:hypothetical protein
MYLYDLNRLEKILSAEKRINQTKKSNLDRSKQYFLFYKITVLAARGL